MRIQYNSYWFASTPRWLASQIQTSNSFQLDHLIAWSLLKLNFRAKIMPRVHATPPPLPENLSERMQHIIDSKTGCCIYHPRVRMCEYVEEKQRWVFRRKTCFQCGARPGAVGGKNHKPGRAMKNPGNLKHYNDLDGSSRSSMSGRSSRSSRSSSSSFGSYH